MASRATRQCNTNRTPPWEERRAARTPEGRANPVPTRPRRAEGPSLALLRRLPAEVAAVAVSRHVFTLAISDVSGIIFLKAGGLTRGIQDFTC